MPNSPRSITLIRHGEKPGETNPGQPPMGVNENGLPDPSSLTPRGWQRAGALAARLGGAQVLSPFARPTALFAPAYPDGAPHRPGETLLPLARRLNLSIQTPVQKGQEALLVSGSLLAQDGQDILVCWEHHHIPAIVAALIPVLGITDGSLPAQGQVWPDADFCSALIFTRQAAGKYALIQTSQDLLDGD